MYSELTFNILYHPFVFDFFFFFLILLISERGREREREKHTFVVASHAPPTGDLARSQACTLTGNQTGTHWFSGRHSLH